jgi:imidazolonepropionase-like amidohydrolase
MLGYTLVKESMLEELREFSLKTVERNGLAESLLSEAREAGRQLGAHLETARTHAAMAIGRAEHAEKICALQAKSIEQLMASNERMVGLVADMRRVGFGILEPIDTNETPDTTTQYDREAVEEDPDLLADDD